MPDAQQYRTHSENSKYRWGRKYPAWNRKKALRDDHLLSDQKGGLRNRGLASSVALQVIKLFTFRFVYDSSNKREAIKQIFRTMCSERSYYQTLLPPFHQPRVVSSSFNTRSQQHCVLYMLVLIRVTFYTRQLYKAYVSA